MKIALATVPPVFVGSCGGTLAPEMFEPCSGQCDPGSAQGLDASGSAGRPPLCPGSDPCALYDGDFGQAGAARIAVDANHVYWADYLGNNVHEVPINGGTDEVLATNAPSDALFDLAVNVTGVYWTTNEAVKSVPVTGGSVRIISSNTVTNQGIAVDEAGVYWTTRAGNSVMGAPLGGGPARTIATGQADPAAIAVAGPSLYWVNESIIEGPPGSSVPDAGPLMTAPLDGGQPVVLRPRQDKGALAVATDAANVYWLEAATAGQQTIRSMPLSGGPAATLATDIDAKDIVTDGVNVYWPDRTSKAIMRVSVTGGSPAILARSIGLPAYVAVDATSVYWTEDADLVMKATK